MSKPKLSMGQIRKHEAVISDPDALMTGMDIAVCSLDEPANVKQRLMQGWAGVLLGEKNDTGAIGRFKEGYGHTPLWGIDILNVGSVLWVNRTNGVHPYPYISLAVSQHDAEKLPPYHRTESVDDISQTVRSMPGEAPFNVRFGSAQLVSCHISFDTMGLAPDTYKMNYFTVDLAKLEE